MVDSRRKFGERLGSGYEGASETTTVPWAHLNSDKILLLVMFKFSEKSSKVLATTATMNMRKNTAKRCPLWWTRGENLARGIYQGMGSGYEGASETKLRVPWAHLNSDKILLLANFKVSDKATEMMQNLPLSFDKTFVM